MTRVNTPYISSTQIDNMIEQVVEFMEVAQSDDSCPNCGEGSLHVEIEANDHKVIRCSHCDWTYCASCGKAVGLISTRDVAIRAIERSKNVRPNSFISIWR